LICDIPNEPNESLSGGVLLGGKLILDELLNGLGFGRGSELTVTKFL
jgi:hypothetical protein